MSTSSKAALAATLGFTLSELREYAYQRPIAGKQMYAIGSHYYLCSKTNPGAFEGLQWKQVPDQFWAERAKTVIWVAHMDSYNT